MVSCDFQAGRKEFYFSLASVPHTGIAMAVPEADTSANLSLTSCL